MKWKYQLLWLIVISLWVAVFALNFPIARIPGPRGIQGIQGEKGETWYNDLPKLYKQTSPAVVWIGAEYDEYYPEEDLYGHRIKWEGTGFFVAPNLIATAGHVTRDTKVFEVMFRDGSRAIADFVYAEERDRCDVGFIQIRSADLRKKRPYLDLDTEVEIGESVVILGYPWGLNNEINYTQGIISSPNRNEPFFGDKSVMCVDAASYPGNSGSPVIDMDGECIGILIGGRYGNDNFSICTTGKILELATQKAMAEVELREAK